MTSEFDDVENWQLRAEAAEAALTRMQVEVEAKLLRSELKAEAIRAGMIDLDGLKLLNMEELTLTDAGEVADAGGVLSKLKRSKPWLFGSGASSSAVANPPRPEPPRMRHANELSHDEWVVARAALARRR